MTFDDYLRGARAMRALSQAELAATTGLPQTTISRLERGRDPRLSELLAVFAALRTPASVRARLTTPPPTTDDP